jgi:hypothetical protein
MLPARPVSSTGTRQSELDTAIDTSPVSLDNLSLKRGRDVPTVHGSCHSAMICDYHADILQARASTDLSAPAVDSYVTRDAIRKWDIPHPETSKLEIQTDIYTKLPGGAQDRRPSVWQHQTAGEWGTAATDSITLRHETAKARRALAWRDVLPFELILRDLLGGRS